MANRQAIMKPVRQAAGPLPITSDLIAQYDMRQGVDSNVVYDISGNANHAIRGAAGPIYQPVWGSTGLIFNTYPQCMETPAAVQGNVITDYWCLSLAFPTTPVPILVPLWYRMPDGRITIGGSAGVESHSSLHAQAGNIVVAVTYGSTPQIFLGGVEDDYFVQGSSVSANTTDGKLFGLYGGFQYFGTLYYRLAYSGTKHTPTQVAQVSSWLSRTLASRGIFTGNSLANSPQVICCGDSLTSGFGSTPDWSGYITQLKALLTDTVQLTMFSISGATAETVSAKVSAKAPAVFAKSSNPLKVVSFLIGSNNLGADESAATIITKITAAVTAARAAGATKVVVVTIPGADWTVYPGRVQATVQARQAMVNAAILALTTGHDYTADITGSAIGNASDGSNATYYYDRLHLKNAGYAIIASAIETALGSCGVT